MRRNIPHPIRDRVGTPLGAFRAFRHGPGTALMLRGANARVVQQRLGHADLRMLARYAHVVPQDQRAAVERTGGEGCEVPVAKSFVPPYRRNSSSHAHTRSFRSLIQQAAEKDGMCKARAWPNWFRFRGGTLSAKKSLASSKQVSINGEVLKAEGAPIFPHSSDCALAW